MACVEVSSRDQMATGDDPAALAFSGLVMFMACYSTLTALSCAPETARLVREIAVMMLQNPNWTILIAGHTDSTGGADHNLRLSEQRAASVKRALVSNGVAAGRLQTVGHDMTKPKADNSTMAGRAINRRVEFRRLDR